MDCAKIKSKKGQMKSTTVCNLCMRRHFPMPHDDRTSALPLFFFFTGLWIRVHLLALPECHFCMQHFFFNAHCTIKVNRLPNLHFLLCRMCQCRHHFHLQYFYTLVYLNRLQECKRTVHRETSSSYKSGFWRNGAPN